MNSFSDSASQSVLGYLRKARRRLGLAFASRGLGATALTALLLTLVVVFWVNQFAFSDASVAGGRLVLFGAVLTVAALWLIRPLLGFDRKRAARHVESRVPAFDGRLETFIDRAGGEKQPNPFLKLLARDTLQVAQTAPAQHIVSFPKVLAYAGLGIFALAALVWVGQSGPGFWGYGTARLWTGWLNPDLSPLYEIQVEPGDVTVREDADLRVTAVMDGFDPDGAELMASFESGVRWEAAPMQRRLEGPGFEFLFTGINEPFQYYIQAEGVRSPAFEVQVVQMPRVQNIRLTYDYPDWARRKNVVEDPGGDIRAIEGTGVTVEVETDRPLEDGLLRVNDEQAVELESGGLTARGKIRVEKDGEYFVAAEYQGESVRLTNDYFITVVPNDKPAVRFARPGRDWQATSIEEVVTEFEASDDFGLRGFDLHYSVNGSDFQTVPLAGDSPQKEAEAKHVFYLEELGPAGSEGEQESENGEEPRLEPGDVIAFYATAADHEHTAKTDMYFIQVRPFSRQFRQSQAGGGMPGGSNPSNQISRRQREIISATWNLDQDRSAGLRGEEEIREDALVLSDVELTLRDQAMTLARRTRARQLAGTNEQFEKFVENLEKAAEFMAPASERLKDQEFQEALGPEQKALQHLLRAEALFRDIQVSFGPSGAGGGQASRDLAEMFELEMDLEKNQYETGPSAPQVEQEIDEALRKLEELAKRQEKLAEQRRQRQTPEFAQRWQQEVLRRQAEELKKRLEELERQQQASQQQGSQRQQSGSQSQQQSAQSSQQQGRGGGSGTSQLRETIERLDQAVRDMEQSRSAAAQGQGSQQEAEAAAERARERLQEALRQLSGIQREQSGNSLSELAERAEGLAGQQRRIEDRLREDLRSALDASESADEEEPRRRRLISNLSLSEMSELADQKITMQEDLEDIERSMQELVRRLRDQQPETARKLREALGDLQESEVATRLRISAEYIRRQLGPQAVPGEETTTRALERLAEQLEEAERLAQNSTQQQQGGLERTLSELESLRQQLERAGGRRGSEGRGASPEEQEGRRLGQAGPGEPREGEDQQRGAGGEQEGEQPGSGLRAGDQQAQQGRGKSQREGQGPSGGRQQAQAGEQGEAEGESRGRRPGEQPSGSQGTRQRWGSSPLRSGDASNYGDRPQPEGLGEIDPETQAAIRSAMEQASRELPRLTEEMRSQGVDLSELKEIRRFVAGLGNSRFEGNPKLLAQERRKLVSLIEQLELEVRRQVEEAEGGEVRAVVAEPVPEQYREAVAEYFRRLSESK